MPVAATIPDRSTRHLAFSRACYAEASGQVRQVFAGDIVKKKWPDDMAALYLATRGPTTAASTTVPEWAGILAQNAFAAFLADLGPASAAAQLIALGVQVNLAGSVSITLPTRSGQAVAAPWVAEGTGIPVTANTLGSAVVGPARKIGTITVWTEELDRVSGAANLFGQILRENVAAALDLAYFSDTAASASAHAGLLNGVVALPASSAGGSAAMSADLAALASAVSGPGSSGEVTFIMARGAAAVLPINLPETQITVLGTDALAAGEVVAVDPKAIVHATDREPEVSASKHVLLHMSDTPQQIGTPPAVVASPSESMFQQGKIALRVLHDVAFAKRRPDAVAWISNADWAAPAVAGTARRSK